MAKRKAAPKEDRSRSEAPQEAPEDSVYIGKSVKPEFIYLRLANRHGLITGATGTGKTVSLARAWRRASPITACRCSAPT